MAKRAQGSGASQANNKRQKTADGQPRIDQFFASPTKAAKNSKDSLIHISSSQPSTSNAACIQSTRDAIIDVDALEWEGAQVPVSPSPKLTDELPAKAQTIGSPRKSDIRLSSTDYLPLDVTPTSYNPAAQPSNTPSAPYSLLTHALVSLSKTRSRISIINILTNLLRTVISKHPSSLLATLYLLSNSLGPQFVAIELGIGSSIISRSIQNISGLSSTALKRLYNRTGDPGDVAFEAKSNIRTLIPHAPLTVNYVHDSLIEISRCKGQGAGKEKQKIVDKLLLASQGEEVRYLTRTLFQNLRVGAVRTSILASLARAFVFTPPPGQPHSVSECLDASDLAEQLKKADALIKQVYSKHPNYDQIVPELLNKGLDMLAERVPLSIGIPLLPMLGSPTRSLEKVYERLGNNQFSAEFKYDGQRAQIHASRTPDGNTEVKIFSRHLENMTSKYPDVIGLFEHMFTSFEGLTSFILDSEIVAIDPTNGGIRPFQELAGRAKKDVNLQNIRVPVCVYAFDLMYLNGKPLLECSFRERRDLLRKIFSPRKAPQEDATLAYFDFVQNCESKEGKLAVEEFLLKAVENRCEGLMIKLLDPAITADQSTSRRGKMKSLPSTYEPDVRTSGWLKLKKDYIESMGDSLDVIPVGAWHGNGRKAQWWSPVLLALWDSKTGRPVALCKCMSGFTDAFYISMRTKYELDTDVCSNKPLWECDFGGYQPDVYFKPHEVWEIRGADITESLVSVAAHGVIPAPRGLSLRFPRFIKVRDDKSIEQASTPSFLVGIWRSQKGKSLILGGKDEGELLEAELEVSDVELSESTNESSSEV